MCSPLAPEDPLPGAHCVTRMAHWSRAHDLQNFSLQTCGGGLHWNCHPRQQQVKALDVFPWKETVPEKAEPHLGEACQSRSRWHQQQQQTKRTKMKKTYLLCVVFVEDDENMAVLQAPFK